MALTAWDAEERADGLLGDAWSNSTDLGSSERCGVTG